MPKNFACLIKAFVTPICCSLTFSSLLLSAQTHTALLPRVQKLHYAEGSLPLCQLAPAESASENNLALKELRDLIHQHCPTSTSPTLPITLTQEIPGEDLPGPDDHPGPSSRESYVLSIDSTGVHIHGRTAAAVFYAVQTLLQMLEGSPANPTLPFAQIEDWPSLPYRGFMMDTSHGGVPTVDEVKRQLDALASWKANQYFFYTETTIDLTGYPLLHQDSNWTPAEVRTIIDYARQRHIDVVPCVELYGHLHDLFKHERYSHMAALPHGGEANPANKDIQSLLDDWLRQYASLFPSPWLHLGFDEPFELERAGSPAAGSIAPDVLWLQHLQHLATLTAQLGKRPLFWADIDEGAYIFNKYPGLAAGLPKGAIAAPWFYDARPDYSKLLDLFSQNHVPILVTSGISDWDNITPDFESTFIDIDGFLAAGRAAHTLGLLNTEWSDSALALHREALPALAYGAIAAWQQQPIDRAHFFTEYAHLRYPSASADTIASALADLTHAQALFREALGSESSFRMWDDPFHSQTLASITTQTGKLHEARLAAEDAEEKLAAARASANKESSNKESGDKESSDKENDDIASLTLAAKMLDYTGMKFLYAVEIAANFNALPAHPTAADVEYQLRREASSRNHSRIGDLIDTAGDLESIYREEWQKQYRPYRLSTALLRWQAEQEYWRHLQSSIWTLTRDFKEGDPRPTLEQALALR